MRTLKAKYVGKTQEERLHGLSVPVIGLTGGISTGKSTVAKLLSDEGFAIINADHLVKAIYRTPETLAFIGARYPEAIHESEINFKLLREKFFSDPGVKEEIERHIYQRLPGAFKDAFNKLNEPKLNEPKLVIYDVPLLFEKKMEALFDLTVLVYTPRHIQKARLMKRDGHLEDMAEVILKQQLDIEDKKTRVDFVIDNSSSLEELRLEVSQFLNQVMA